MDFDRAQFFKRRVYIDEDGYPMIDGLRIDDASSLEEIFTSLRRSGVGGGLASTLVTTWGGCDATVESFSSPFVVQSVARISDERFYAHIFGSLKFEFSIQDVEIDEWNRVHLYLGEEKIEATFARKAQAQFFLLLDAEHVFHAFRAATTDVSAPTRWENAYAAKTDGWDLGKVSPAFVELASNWLVADKISRKILVPGAGRGYEAQWLSARGHRVVAEDFAGPARQEFVRLNPDSKVSFQTRDFFEALPGGGATFDAIGELTFFCAIDPVSRSRYFETCWNRLEPGGLLVGIFFMNHAPGGPPFSTTPWELRAYAEAAGFTIKHWQMSQASVTPRLGKEFEVVVQKPI